MDDCTLPVQPETTTKAQFFSSTDFKSSKFQIFIPHEPEKPPANPSSPPNMSPNTKNSTPAQQTPSKIRLTEQSNRFTTAVTTEKDIVASLRLIADSVAQQRQIAAKAVLTNPLYWTAMLFVSGSNFKLMYNGPADWLLILITWSGCWMASLSAVKFFLRGYLEAAEHTGRWTWLYPAEDTFYDSRPCRPICRVEDGLVSGSHYASAPTSPSKFRDRWDTERNRRNESDFRRQSMSILETSAARDKVPKPRRDTVLVSLFEGEVIATVVLRLVQTNTAKSVDCGTDNPNTLGHVSDYSRPASLQAIKPLIRAWTVRQRYRGYGIGTEILEFAVRYSREMGWEDPAFAEDHAHSLRLIPSIFNARMDRVERQARERLARECLECEFDSEKKLAEMM